MKASDTEPPKVARRAVFAAIGKTWFDLTEEDGRFELETRLHGDVGEGAAGEEDKTEGQRLLAALRKAFPVEAYKSTFDVVEEWVSVEIRIDPLDARERSERSRAARAVQVHDKIKGITEAVNEAARAEKRNLRGPVSFHVSAGRHHLPDAVEVRVEFGERFLYSNHLGAGIKFATAEEAADAGRRMLAVLPGVEWIMSTGKRSNRTTFNKPEPHNIIETTGWVTFSAPLDVVAEVVV